MKWNTKDTWLVVRVLFFGKHHYIRPVAAVLIVKIGYDPRFVNFNKCVWYIILNSLIHLVVADRRFCCNRSSVFSYFIFVQELVFSYQRSKHWCIYLYKAVYIFTSLIFPIIFILGKWSFYVTFTVIIKCYQNTISVPCDEMSFLLGVISTSPHSIRKLWLWPNLVSYGKSQLCQSDTYLKKVVSKRYRINIVSTTHFSVEIPVPKRRIDCRKRIATWVVVLCSLVIDRNRCCAGC